MRNLIIAAVCIAPLALVGCDSKSSSASSSAQSSAATSASAGAAWILASMPEGVVDVGEAKKTLKEGDHVALRGKIGGRKDPITHGAAVFVMMDAAVPSCADGMMDHCATPWDYCCEAPDTITANNATVQVIDGAGKAVETDLKSAGFSPLDTVVVVGTVGPRPSDAVLTIKATGIYKVGG